MAKLQAQGDPRAALRAYLLRHGLRASRQRDTVVEAFLASEGHLRVDELLARVRARDPRISLATVYRTLKLLTESGLAEARHFLDGQTRYERSDAPLHHDHLICTGCGTIVEFVHQEIEALQHRVAEAHGFTVVQHKMELYGLCRPCRQAAASP